MTYGMVVPEKGRMVARADEPQRMRHEAAAHVPREQRPRGIPRHQKPSPQRHDSNRRRVAQYALHWHRAVAPIHAERTVPRPARQQEPAVARQGHIGQVIYVAIAGAVGIPAISTVPSIPKRSVVTGDAESGA